MVQALLFGWMVLQPFSLILALLGAGLLQRRGSREASPEIGRIIERLGRLGLCIGE